jgi:regulator of RNase E activity RraA
MEEILAKLRDFDTPTICNIIEIFDIRPRNMGYMDHRIKACFPEMPPMVGFAATAAFRSSVPPRKGDVYSSLEAQVERFAELSGPPVVVFQDLDQPAVAATFGEIMCTTSKSFGAVGLITSGTGRDLDQVRKLNFPVFTDGTICSHSYSHIVNTHVLVHVDGLATYPDDLLHGDCNGVTTIPREIAAEIADVGEEYIAAEMVIIDAMRQSNSDLKLLCQARAESQARMAQLRARVSRAK